MTRIVTIDLDDEEQVEAFMDGYARRGVVFALESLLPKKTLVEEMDGWCHQWQELVDTNSAPAGFSGLADWLFDKLRTAAREDLPWLMSELEAEQ